MEKVSRTGISFDKGLLKYFDKAIKEKGYTNRSEAINDIIRDYLHKEKKKGIFGIIKIVYDPRQGHYNKKIAELQHEYNCMIISTMKNYLDKHTCIEMLVVKGVANRIGVLMDKIKKSQGVKNVEFSQIA